MAKETKIEVNTRRILSTSNSMIYGHFIEHFHRQIYGGIFDPASPLQMSKGFVRTY
ncbi:alpha-N-arabinofuranosidase [Gracilibacillus orientalis]|uniref:Alpha-N-arabinofuranosidase n=1 Tax=Gracilibacillus orientalis TaxID=334253 RepID=A0A1I4H1S7_9BACI|nr:alpha-N-arabinofuranosidase [Gracilibacillus orientalis]